MSPPLGSVFRSPDSFTTHHHYLPLVNALLPFFQRYRKPSNTNTQGSSRLETPFVDPRPLAVSFTTFEP